MRVWAVANQKGGVGKTTTAVTLGGWLARRGQRVLLVDLDPHGSLTSYFGFDPESNPRSGYVLFKRAAEHKPLAPRDQIEHTAVEGLDLLCASTAMATLDRQLGNTEGMGLVIARTLQGLDEDYDYALIDCPPMLGVLMVNALAACEHLIIPVQTEFLALKGLERMLRTLQMVQRSRNFSLEYTIVPTLFDKRTRASLETLRTLRERYPEQLWNGVIPVDTRFREASLAGVPLSIMRPGARGAQHYRQLLEYLLHEEPAPAAINS
ncbi:MAG: ParA family protein [Gammaproteobacteria bacterium]|nr:MAG: ParA family protein [Gammaproteobacteria bacterium]